MTEQAAAKGHKTAVGAGPGLVPLGQGSLRR
jgi:hypothetical protein